MNKKQKYNSNWDDDSTSCHKDLLFLEKGLKRDDGKIIGKTNWAESMTNTGTSVESEGIVLEDP